MRQVIGRFLRHLDAEKNASASTIDTYRYDLNKFDDNLVMRRLFFDRQPQILQKITDAGFDNVVPFRDLRHSNPATSTAIQTLPIIFTSLKIQQFTAQGTRLRYKQGRPVLPSDECCNACPKRAQDKSRWGETSWNRSTSKEGLGNEK